MPFKISNVNQRTKSASSLRSYSLLARPLTVQKFKNSASHLPKQARGLGERRTRRDTRRDMQALDLKRRTEVAQSSVRELLKLVDVLRFLNLRNQFIIEKLNWALHKEYYYKAPPITVPSLLLLQDGTPNFQSLIEFVSNSLAAVLRGQVQALQRENKQLKGQVIQQRQKTLQLAESLQLKQSMILKSECQRQESLLVIHRLKQRLPSQNQPDLNSDISLSVSLQKSHSKIQQHQLSAAIETQLKRLDSVVLQHLAQSDHLSPYPQKQSPKLSSKSNSKLRKISKGKVLEEQSEKEKVDKFEYDKLLELYENLKIQYRQHQLRCIQLQKRHNQKLVAVNRLMSKDNSQIASSFQSSEQEIMRIKERLIQEYELQLAKHKNEPDGNQRLKFIIHMHNKESNIHKSMIHQLKMTCNLAYTHVFLCQNQIEILSKLNFKLEGFLKTVKTNLIQFKTKIIEQTRQSKSQSKASQQRACRKCDELSSSIALTNMLANQELLRMQSLIQLWTRQVKGLKENPDLQRRTTQKLFRD